ncbi:MAG TPA: hypothetical protein VKZ59_12965 [Acidobacteriota bacterium]|nr:hypothetical protein [Acidobacteriota bacterium]
MKLTELKPYNAKDQDSNHRNRQHQTGGTPLLQSELPNEELVRLHLPGKLRRVSAPLPLTDRLESFPPSVQRLVRRIQFCCDRKLYDLALLSCRNLLEIAIFEFLRKNIFPQLDVDQLFKHSLQFWVDSLCRWSPSVWLSSESCATIKAQAVRLTHAAEQQVFREKSTDNLSQSGLEVIAGTLNVVRLLFPAGAERH